MVLGALLRRHWLTLVVHVGALAPLARLAWDAARDELTVNPIQEATLRTGFAALVLLVLSLACAPLGALLDFKRVLALRRPLGLYAFGYASLHLAIFVAVDYGFDFEFIGREIAEKLYVIAGFAAYLLLLPLAVTSTRGWMRRLGKRWKRLHRLVYVAAPLAVVHFLWLVKADIRAPLLWGAIVAGLLLLRVPPIRRAIIAARDRVA